AAIDARLRRGRIHRLRPPRLNFPVYAARHSGRQRLAAHRLRCAVPPRRLLFPARRDGEPRRGEVPLRGVRRRRVHVDGRGAVASAIAVPLHLDASGSATLFYWICAGRTYDEVRDLHQHVLSETPARILARTGSHWYTWVNKPDRDLSDLPDEITELYRRSLLIIAKQ